MGKPFPPWPRAALDRRAFLQALGLSGLSLGLGCAAGGGPLPAALWKPLEQNELPFAGLATSLPAEHDYEARLEGRLPAGLEGTLYRNGPGIFDRGGRRRRNILDGDGMIQAYDLRGGRVRFRNRFVRTRKYREEEAAGHFLYRSPATMAPGGVLANLGLRFGNPASISVVRRGERLYAFDEDVEPYELDAETLETLGPSALGAALGMRALKSHSKIDGRTGEWLHFAMTYSGKGSVRTAAFGNDGETKSTGRWELPRRVYLHDWLVSQNHVVFLLHPAFLSLGGILLAGLGLRNLAEAIRWRPADGNLLLVAERKGGGTPLALEAEASWMWHGVNAYEEGSELVVDFVGFPAAPVLAGEAAPQTSIMMGQHPEPVPHVVASALRRYRVSIPGKRLREETVSTDPCEMPFVHQRAACGPYRYAYVALQGRADWFWSGVGRVDTRTGSVERFDFGPGRYCVEPVFAPRPGAGPAGPERREEPGWLLTVVYSASTHRSFLAVLDAEALSDGPVAVAHLTHHVPLSLHGFWSAA